MKEEVKTKVCTRCGIEKLITEFAKNNNRKDGLQFYCKSCSKELMQEWRNNNREHVRKIQNQWGKNHRDKRRIQEKKWKDTHKEQYKARVKKWRELNADILREKHKEYYQNNSKKLTEAAKDNYRKNLLRRLLSSRIRNARKMNLLYDHIDILYNYLNPTYQDGKCECCGKYFQESNKNIQDDSLSIDQIVPGNGYVLNNIALLCGRCNRIKNNGTWQEHQMISTWQKEKEDFLLFQNNQIQS